MVVDQKNTKKLLLGLLEEVAQVVGKTDNHATRI